jgi:hypothetical protein
MKRRPTEKEKGDPAMSLGFLLVLVLLLLVLGGLPTWGYSRGWGYGPSGLLGLVLVVVLVLVLLGRL